MSRALQRIYRLIARSKAVEPVKLFYVPLWVTIRLMRNHRLLGAAAILAFVGAVGLHATQSAGTLGVDTGKIDAVFARWTPSTPGCAVGASIDGRPLVEKAYGMADLEHDVPNTPETIFEAGSVSKQFTAAAVLLLARDGKLSLDDPVREYIPELPDYDARGVATAGRGSVSTGTGAGGPTIRQMLNHTSGLRDWGSVEAIAGWPRTSRVYTHAHVLDIVSRQRALNFPAGTQWSYSNTGYNLAAIIVSRVSGIPFADFTRARIFTPLGMTHTSWRDDHTRVVKHRAIAYAEKKDGFHTDMPFEDIHGNGGLLTTVGDLLKWNENFAAPVVGDGGFVAEQQRAGHFNDGRTHNYGLGLFIGRYNGVREVSHSGSTAGYQAFLTRFPDQHVSVAVLCNATSARAPQYAHAVSDLLLGDALKPPPSKGAAHSAAEIAAAQGLYRNVDTGVYARIAPGDGNGAGAADRLRPDQTWQPDGHGRLKVTDEFGTVEIYERIEPAAPTAAQLAELAGTYTSDEAETTFNVVVKGDKLVMQQRPDLTMTLTPVYADAFRGAGQALVIFRRDAGGRPAALSLVESRVWDLRFTRRN